VASIHYPIRLLLQPSCLIRDGNPSPATSSPARAARLFTASIFRLELVFLSYCMLIVCTPAAESLLYSTSVKPTARKRSLSHTRCPARQAERAPRNHGDVIAPRSHAPAASTGSLGLSSRPPSVEAAVWSTQLGTQELQLQGHEHEEAEHGLLHAAAGAGVVTDGEPGRRHVVKPACRPEVHMPLHRSYQMRSANCLCYSPQLATPRRSLFTSNLFQQVDTRGTWQCSWHARCINANVLQQKEPPPRQ